MAFLVAFSLGLAWLSWRYVEEPFRHPKAQNRFTSPKFVGYLGAASIAFLAAFAGVGNATKGLPVRLPHDLQEFDAEFRFSKKCLFSKGDEIPHFPNLDCSFNPEQEKKYILWGDSVAAALAPNLASGLLKHGISLEQLTLASCRPVLGVTLVDISTADRCQNFNDDVLEYIRRAGASTVILAAQWTGFLGNQSHLIDKRIVSAAEDPQFRQVRERLAQTIGALNQLGLRVVLVYPTIEAERQIREVVASYRIRGFDHVDLTVTKDQMEGRLRQAQEWLDALGDVAMVRVNPNRYLCEQSGEGVCVLATDGKPILADRVHPTSFGAGFMATSLFETIGLASADEAHILNFDAIHKRMFYTQ